MITLLILIVRQLCKITDKLGSISSDLMLISRKLDKANDLKRIEMIEKIWKGCA